MKSSERVRILMLNHNLRGNGTWHRAWQLGRELARRGHRVTLWTAAPHHFYRPAAEVRDGVSIVETPSWAPLAGADDGWGPLDAAWRAWRILREPFDLCYAFAHPPTVALPAWLAQALRRRPLLYDWCDWYEGGVFVQREALRRAGLAGPLKPAQRWVERREGALERWMARSADRMTVISEFLRERALNERARRPGVASGPGDVLLLPNGADLAGIRPLPAADCRAALGLPAAGLYLGYIANYHPDQELLLGALVRAVATVPELKLILAGPPFAASLVERLGLAGHIVELGPQPYERIPLVLGAADVLALPLADHDFNRSRMPFKFTDYLAAGRPIVTNRVGDLARWFPQDSAPAIGLASAPSAEAYGQALAALFAPGVDRAALGAAARRLAEREFSWSVLVDRLEGLLAQWLPSRSPRPAATSLNR